MKDLIQAANKYAAHGIATVPLNSEKRPLLEGWTENPITAKNPPEQCGAFATAKGLGTVCGKISGGLEGIDVDTKYDLTGTIWPDLWQTIQDNLPDIPFVVVETPSGGKHIVYRCAFPDGNKHLAYRPATAKELEESPHKKKLCTIETRGEGGQLAAFPSKGYKVIQGKYSEIPFLEDEQRACLWAVCRSFNEYKPEPQKPATRPKTNARAMDANPFKDFNDRASIPDLLQSIGFEFAGQKGQRHYFKRPGTKAEQSGNWHSGLNLFYCWSPNTVFEPEKAYSPVDVWKAIENIQDNKEAYARLIQDGYGEKITKSEEQEPDEEDEPEESRPLIGTPFFEDWIFAKLPYPLNKICSMYNGRERDISLIVGLTAASAVLSNTWGIYKNKETHTNLFGIVVATAGTGKGLINYARPLCKSTIHNINEENQRNQMQHEADCMEIKQRDGKNAVLPEAPKPKKFFISANATTKGLINQIDTNGDLGAFAVETEIDSVTNMSRSEHGDITGVMRNAWEHESIGTVRATVESNDIESPKLSLLLAGTPGQLPKLFPDAENGLFSRCMLYAFKTAPVMENPVASKVSYKAIFENFSHDLEDIRGLGESRIEISFEQGEQIRKMYQPLLNRYRKMNGDDSTSVVFRMAKMSYKIAAILQRLKIGKEFVTHTEVEQDIFEVACSISDTLLKHSFNVFDMLFAKKLEGKRKRTKEEKEAQKSAASANALFDTLPETFKTAEAVEVGGALGISESTVKRSLRNYAGRGLLCKEGHGVYNKCKD